MSIDTRAGIRRANQPTSRWKPFTTTWSTATSSGHGLYRATTHPPRHIPLYPPDSNQLRGIHSPRCDTARTARPCGWAARNHQTPAGVTDVTARVVLPSRNSIARGQIMSIDSHEPDRVHDRTDTPATAEPGLDQMRDSERMALITNTTPFAVANGSPPGIESGDRAGPTASERMLAVEKGDASPSSLPPATDTSDRANDKPIGELPRGPDHTRSDDVAAPDVHAPAAVVALGSREVEALRPRDVTSRHVLPEICRTRQVDTREGLEAVQRSYDVVHDKVAPFLVHHMAGLIERSKTELATDPDHRYVFVGRDGYCLAAIAGALDPDFLRDHCSYLLLTRRMVEAGLQDEEINGGKTFDVDDTFRKYKSIVTAEETQGAKADLTEHLENHEVPVTEPGRNITLIDTSLKGSAQEGLSALYPAVNFDSRLLFFAQSPADPHPDSKTGLALHMLAPEDGSNPTVESLPEDRSKTFAHPEAIFAVEDLLHGPWSTAKGFGEDGQPIQELEPPPVDELNPLDISPAFGDPATRLAAADAMVLAARDRAFEAAQRRDRGADWRAELGENAEEFVDQVRSRISGEETDTDLAEVLGSFARRIDRGHIAALRNAIADHGLDAAETDAEWHGYQQAGSLEEKETYVAEFTQRMARS